MKRSYERTEIKGVVNHNLTDRSISLTRAVRMISVVTCRFFNIMEANRLVAIG